MRNKTEKAEMVIDRAIEILRKEGDRGVTMRRVAQDAGMSLSNVQYYFKNKDDLLQAMADRYFYRCLDAFREQEFPFEDGNRRVVLHDMVRSFLIHGLEVSDMCRIFREYWALATRNDEIEKYLINYYRELAVVLKEKLRPLSSDEDALEKAVSLFIPLVEGYSITCPALPVELDPMSTLTTGLMVDILEGDGLR